MYSYVNHTIDN